MARPKISIAKQLLSYIKFIPVETTSSEYSNLLEVVFFEGRYMLNTRNATYSFEDKYSSFKTALRTIGDDLTKINSALVLGLGLGSVPQMLQQIYQFKGMIDCIEIDEQIIGLAEKYYPDEKLFSRLRITQKDAFDWIEQDHNCYDLVAVDIFIDKNIPRKFHEKNFLENLKSHLNPGGILLMSRLKENKEREFLLWENIRTIFSDGIDIDTGGNLILRYKKATETGN